MRKNNIGRWMLPVVSVLVLLAFTGLPRVWGGSNCRNSVAQWVWTERSADFGISCSLDNPICLEWCEPHAGGLVGTGILCCRAFGEDPQDPECNEVPW